MINAQAAISEATRPQAVLFTLAGGGDRYIFWAPKVALDWCLSAVPGTSVKVPDEVRAALEPFIGKEDYNREALEEEVYVTSGSADNDVALCLNAICRSFDTMKQAQAYAKTQGWDICDEEYDGCIY